MDPRTQQFDMKALTGGEIRGVPYAPGDKITVTGIEQFRRLERLKVAEAWSPEPTVAGKKDGEGQPTVDTEPAKADTQGTPHADQADFPAPKGSRPRRR